MHASHDLVLAPLSGFVKTSFDQVTKHFAVDRCDARRHMDEKRFIQIRKLTTGNPNNNPSHFLAT
jgi:hypothetical protein